MPSVECRPEGDILKDTGYPIQMKTYAKFAVLVVAIIGTLAWLAASGINESKTYYKTISEVKAMQGAR